jgi:Flp pilus assembly pilin Flp
LQIEAPFERQAKREQGFCTNSKLKLQGAKKMIKKFFNDETGLELSEYAVAAALIAIATVAAFQLLGVNIGGKITALANTVK